MGFNEWVTFATVLLSVVSVGIAIYSARSTSKDANRQIASIKELARIQLEVAIETKKSEAKIYLANMNKVEQNRMKYKDLFSGKYYLMTAVGKEYQERKYQEHLLLSEKEFYQANKDLLMQKIEGLEALKSKLE